jgi:hypothetical protein
VTDGTFTCLQERQKTIYDAEKLRKLRELPVCPLVFPGFPVPWFSPLVFLGIRLRLAGRNGRGASFEGAGKSKKRAKCLSITIPNSVRGETKTKQQWSQY